MRHFKFTILAGVALGCLAAEPASAQKSANHFRFAVTEVQKGIGQYIVARREGYFLGMDIYERLIAYDDENKKFLPQLATSWKAVNPTTYEFELRQDVTFHNGNKFDADDVVNLFNTVIDNKNPLAKNLFNTFKFSFVERAEKLGPYKVRIVVKSPSPLNEMNIAQRFQFYDWETLQAAGGFAEYETKGVGSGPYRVLETDPNKGVVLGKHESYVAAPGRRPAGYFSRVSSIFMPDQNTQIANLLAGGVEMVREVNQDQLNEVTSRKGFTVTAVDEYAMLELAFDAAGRTGNAPLKDVRVRKALIKAIDREKLKVFLPGGNFATIHDAMCLPTMLACNLDGLVRPDSYDPAGAKKLLAEAGYANGFTMELTARTATSAASQAVIDMWRQVGVTATLDMSPSAVVRKKRAQGKLQADLHGVPYHPMPDASLMIDYLVGAENEDYIRDPMINQWGEQGAVELDPVKREKIYSQIVNRINEQAYTLPLITTPTIYLHTDQIKVSPKQLSTTASLGDFRWK